MKGGNTNCKMDALQRASKALLEASQCSINRESELPQAASPQVASTAINMLKAKKFANKLKKKAGLFEEREGSILLPNGQEGTYRRFFNPSTRTKDFDDMTGDELYGTKDENGVYSKSYSGPNKPGVYAVISPGFQIMEINSNNQWEMQNGNHKGHIYDGEKWIAPVSPVLEEPIQLEEPIAPVSPVLEEPIQLEEPIAPVSPVLEEPIQLEEPIAPITTIAPKKKSKTRKKRRSAASHRRRATQKNRDKQLKENDERRIREALERREQRKKEQRAEINNRLKTRKKRKTTRKSFDQQQQLVGGKRKRRKTRKSRFKKKKTKKRRNKRRNKRKTRKKKRRRSKGGFAFGLKYKKKKQQPMSKADEKRIKDLYYQNNFQYDNPMRSKLDIIRQREQIRGNPASRNLLGK